MKILHTADWHLGTFKSPVKNGQNLRSEDTKRCLDELVRIAMEEKPDLTLICGDIFHVGRTSSERCCEELVTATKYIKQLADASKNVIVMRGTPNHDGEGVFHVLSEEFALLSNVYIVMQPTVVEMPEVDVAVLPGFDAGFFRASYPACSKTEENTVFTEHLSNIVLDLKDRCHSDKKNILMSHYTVPGCNTESGQVMFLAQFEPVLSADTLNKAGFDLVALGHIHRPQQLKNVENAYYSGAVNALNFNDEGQERGFFIHTERLDGGWNPVFYNTPSREFLTIHLDNDDVSDIVNGDVERVAVKWQEDIPEKIVRVQYVCSHENTKAFQVNRGILERKLLDDGAFMVWGIFSEGQSDEIVKEGLSGAIDAEQNLIQYLEKKRYDREQIAKFVQIARPIIEQAQAKGSSAAYTGVFEPVAIEVENYRNYEYEKFSFSNIHFCAINGQNGAGKSSLFMDAIIDCLYEEPREEELTGWIKSNASKGAIQFTFKIGEKTFRVTRTRTRSKRVTLRLAEWVDDEWQNRSKEKVKDTQQAIIDLIGMDCLTFKSCALIMQDQYGFFLEAPKKERMEILGNLLGLGVYQLMERITQEIVKGYVTTSRELQQAIQLKGATLETFGEPDKELQDRKFQLTEQEAELQKKTLEREKKQLQLHQQQIALQKVEELEAAIRLLEAKKRTVVQNQNTQQEILEASRAILETKEEIRSQVARYHSLLSKAGNLASEVTLYTAKKGEKDSLEKELTEAREQVQQIEAEIQLKEQKLSFLQPTATDSEIQEKAKRYQQKKQSLDVMQEKMLRYQEAKHQYDMAMYRYEEISRQFDSEGEALRKQQKMLEKKVAILNQSGCIDIERAHCQFLQDALEAREQLSGMDGLWADMEAKKQDALTAAKAVADKQMLKMQTEGFEADVFQKLQDICKELYPYVEKAHQLQQKEVDRQFIQAELKNFQTNLLQAQQRCKQIGFKVEIATQECQKYENAYQEYQEAVKEIEEMKIWLEREKELTVAEERQKNATGRMEELARDLVGIHTEIATKNEVLDIERQKITDLRAIKNDVYTLEDNIQIIQKQMQDNQIQIGALQQKVEQVQQLQREIKDYQKQIVELSNQIADYEVLKVAFGQDGIPHQIVRSMIPKITEIANTILGQMTGGKMGVEFKLDKLKGGREKKEVLTLDIFIEEYGKPELPYLSKSGGEKVKVSLSVILALSEIKASAAGIQLGMLFIDEPPFLDEEGVQAYCDALEAIQSRYENMKVMAITHNQAMKERFPQSIEVIKTEEGSKVQFLN